MGASDAPRRWRSDVDDAAADLVDSLPAGGDCVVTRRGHAFPRRLPLRLRIRAAVVADETACRVPEKH
jgi:hypothetical protein